MANNVEYILSLKDLFTNKIQGAINATDKLDGAVARVGNTASSMGGMLSKALAIFGAGAFAKGVFDTGKQFEQYEVGLKTFLKSNEAASAAFAGIKEDAQKTPFEVEGLFKGNMALISAGESAGIARRNVLGLANAIAATGGGDDELQRMVSNLQQIKNVGHATAADIRQFGYAGINIYGALAAATGKTKEQVKEMKFSYEDITGALNKAAGAGGIFEGAMANAMNTTQGKWSNLKDTVTFLKDKIFVAFQPVINRTMELMSRAIDGISRFVNGIGDIGSAFRPVLDVFQYAWSAIMDIGNAFNWTSGQGSVFGNVMNAVGGILYLLKPLAIGIISVMTPLVKLVVGLVNGLAAMVVYIAELFGYQAKGLDLGEAKISKRSGIGAGRKVSSVLSGNSGFGGISAGIPGKSKASDLGSSVSAVSGSKPTSIVINIQKLVENQNFDGSATANIKAMAPKVKDEMIKAFMMMLNDSQQLTTV